LVHGLWSSVPMWRSFTGYLSHRGWSCFAVELRRTDAAAVQDVQALIADLRVMVGMLDAPPVIVGHDLGGVIAQHCAAAARALVSLAPLVLPPLTTDAPQALRDAGSMLARLL